MPLSRLEEPKSKRSVTVRICNINSFIAHKLLVSLYEVSLSANVNHYSLHETCNN
ncbi:hypothetical protein HanRHA438_Chr15g0697021 [Helianthus annuus]|nr:hypothetical protein HanRHA438_Chr15g0697021 [Helianthus annuus]